MTPADLTAWRDRMGLNQTRAAIALGISRNALIAYETGKQQPPRYVELASKWLEIEPLLGAMQSEPIKKLLGVARAG